MFYLFRLRIFLFDMKNLWLFIITVLYIILSIQGKKHKHKHESRNHTKSNNNSRSMDSRQSRYEQLKGMTENRLVYKYVIRKVRILCMVMTHPANHKTRARYIKATWGKRCNKLVFFSTGKDRILKTVKLPVDHHNQLKMSRAAFSYAYGYYKEKIDWFLKVYDDTYVVVENLRYLLAQYSPTMLVTFSEKKRIDFFSNVLNSTGKCLDGIGVKIIDTRDNLMRGRLFPVSLHEFYNLLGQADFYFWEGNFFATDEGLDWCSDELITLKTKEPKDIYVLDYLIYGLRLHRDKDNESLIKMKSTEYKYFVDITSTIQPTIRNGAEL